MDGNAIAKINASGLSPEAKNLKVLIGEEPNIGAQIVDDSAVTDDSLLKIATTSRERKKFRLQGMNVYFSFSLIYF